MMSRVAIGAAAAAVLLLAGCGGTTGSTAETYTNPKNDRLARANQAEGSILGEGGLNILGGPRRSEPDPAGGGIGVNSFLWRASLDTLSFMPLASADPFGGVIITEWHTPPETPAERVKVNVFILDRQLRADGIRAAVFRQTRNGAGQWVDAAVDPKTATELENSILTRARQLRINTAQQ